KDQFDPKDFRGKIILFAFLDHAKPSQRLLPRLKQWQDQWAAKGLVVLRVNEGPADEAELKKCSPTGALMVAPGIVAGGQGDAFRRYGVQATPALVLIDRQGILRGTNVEVDDMARQLETVLKR